VTESIIPGNLSAEGTEGRRDVILEMILNMIEEANQTHLDILAASAMSDHSAFDAYNKLSQLDANIETLVRMRMNNKHRVAVHYWTQ